MEGEGWGGEGWWQEDGGGQDEGLVKGPLDLQGPLHDRGAGPAAGRHEALRATGRISVENFEHRRMVRAHAPALQDFKAGSNAWPPRRLYLGLAEIVAPILALAGDGRAAMPDPEFVLVHLRRGPRPGTRSGIFVVCRELEAPVVGVVFSEASFLPLHANGAVGP